MDSKTYSTMSVDHLGDAIQTMVAVHQTFYLHSCLCSHHAAGSTLHDWVDKMADATVREVNRMLAEMARRDLNEYDKAILEGCVAMTAHMVTGVRQFEVTVTRVTGEPVREKSKVDGLVDVQDALYEGIVGTRTAWLALTSNSLVDEDIVAVSDALGAAIGKLAHAEKELANVRG